MKIYYTIQERTILKNLLTSLNLSKDMDLKDKRKFKSMLNKFNSTGASISLKEPEIKLVANILHQILEAREFKSEEQKQEFESLPAHDKEYHSAYNTLLLVLLEKLTIKLGLNKDVQSN